MAQPVALFRRLCLAAVLAAAVTGCQTFGGHTVLKNSVTEALSVGAAEAIAIDMVEGLSTLAGPRDTVIALSQDRSAFGQAIASSLRQRGYAIAQSSDAPDVGGMPLVYAVDYHEGNFMVRLSAGALKLTRIYGPSGGGAEPVSALSIMLGEATKPK